MHLTRTLLFACGLAVAGTACHANGLPPIKPVASVDLLRFMGDWYVIATVPTRSIGRTAAANSAREASKRH